jgi:hypothetical protein
MLRTNDDLDWGKIMMFTKRLRPGVRNGEITVSVRIWHSPRVKVGHRYRMEEGEIEIDSIEPIGLPDITPELARASGFLGVLDLLKVAQHGRGNKIYLVRFHYMPPKAAKKRAAVKRPAQPSRRRIGQREAHRYETVAATGVAAGFPAPPSSVRRPKPTRTAEMIMGPNGRGSST